MDTIAELAACDVVKILVSGQYTVDPAVVPGGQLAAPHAYCIPKDRGQLTLTLTAEELGLPAFPFDATLRGAPAGQDGAGRALVRWRIDQTVGVHVAQADVTVDWVRGEITTAVTALAPPIRHDDCGGTCHQHTIQLSAVGSADELVVGLHRTIAGIDHHATARVTHIALFGTAGRRALGELEVGLVKNECGIGAVHGGTARFFSFIQGQPTGPVTYEWQVSGAAPIGATDQRSLRVQVPENASAFTVTLLARVGSCTISKRRVVHPMTPRQAQLTELICRIITRYTRLRWLVDPLTAIRVQSPLRDAWRSFLRSSREALAVLRGR